MVSVAIRWNAQTFTVPGKSEVREQVANQLGLEPDSITVKRSGNVFNPKDEVIVPQSAITEDEAVRACKHVRNSNSKL